MIPKYANFTLLNENLQKARKVLGEVKVPETDPNFIKLRALLNRNMGYLGKFTEWMYKNKTSYEQLETLFNRIKKITLPKQIDEYKTPEEVIDSIIRDDSETAVHQMINAIPSRTREHLKESGNECPECSGDGNIECGECYGNGENDCEDCYGNGQYDCDACDGSGDIECEKCGGDGTVWNKKREDVECPKCKGDGRLPCPNSIEQVVVSDKEKEGKCDNGTIHCTKCDGDGQIPCPKKCDNGQVECPVCKGSGTDQEGWNRLLSFLALQKDKKDIIIDFLSKKSGRYHDYDEDACDKLKDDISKLLNMSSIDEIKKIALTITNNQITKRDNRGHEYITKEEPYIKFIYDDEKYLIVAVNWEGLQKFGSTYWCITEDEDTYHDYVTSNTNMQLILFVKGKVPLVDEQSVMGITINFRKEIEAAHWEDDDECVDVAESIINGKTTSFTNTQDNRGRNILIKNRKQEDPLKINTKYLLDAFLSLYGYDRDELGGIEFEVPDLYNPLIDNILNPTVPIKLKKGEQNSVLEKTLDDYLESNENDNFDKLSKSDFIKELKKRTNEKNKKLPIRLDHLIQLDLSDICEFNKKWLDNSIINTFHNSDVDSSNKESIIRTVRFFIDNGYDITKISKDLNRFNIVRTDEYVDLLVKNEVLPIEEFYKFINWSRIDDKFLKWLIQNHIEFIHSSKELSLKAIKFIDSNDLIGSCKDGLIKLIESGKFPKDVCEYIASEIDDNEVSIEAAKQILPKGLLNKFKFEISRLVGSKKEDVIKPKKVASPVKKKKFENLKGFDSFKVIHF